MSKVSKVPEILKLRESMSDIIDCATCYENVMSSTCTYPDSITTNDIIEIIESFSSHTITDVIIVQTDVVRPVIFMRVNNAGYFRITPFMISNTNYQEMVSLCTNSIQCCSWGKFKAIYNVDKTRNLLKAKL